MKGPYMTDRFEPAPPLPPELPAPEDDGAADHLPGMTLPRLRLASTGGSEEDVAGLASGGLVLFVFPGMGPPSEADPPGWRDTSGAYGCTQESCGFRDRHDAFSDLGFRVAGLSAQAPERQLEAARRLHLPYPLLADPDRAIGGHLNLPTFSVDGSVYYKRLTLVARAGRIVRVFYPVFPPDEHPADVLAWIVRNP